MDLSKIFFLKMMAGIRLLIPSQIFNDHESELTQCQSKKRKDDYQKDNKHTSMKGMIEIILFLETSD